MKTKSKNKFFVFLFIPLLAGFFAVEKCRAEENSIIINEVMYDPDGSDNSSSAGENSYEWIELKNISSEEKDIQDYELRADTYFSLSAIKNSIPSEGFIVIYEGTGNNKNTDFSEGNIAYLYMNKSGSHLGNNSDDISLYKSNANNKDTIIDYIAYGKIPETTNSTHASDSNIWNKNDFISDVDEGYSIARKVLGFDNNLSSDFEKSLKKSGTPGKENSAEPEPEKKPEEKTNYTGKIKINEIKAETSDEEFVEIINNSGETDLDFLKWCIKDEIKYNKTSWSCKKPSSVEKKDNFYILYGSFSLNNDSGGDIVYLYDEDKNLIDSVSYKNAKIKYTYSFDGSDWKWTSKITPGEKNKFDETVSGKLIRIVKLSPNPKGNDTKNEYIILENKSKKKINLKGWSIATGWENLSNHPIQKDFEIKAGKTKKLTRKYCAFTLNNTKTKIELRSPDGKVAQKIKYDRKKDKIEEDELYQKNSSGWEWLKTQTDTETAPANAEENNSAENPPLPLENEEIPMPEEIINPIPNEEIQANLGKYSEDPIWQKKQENRLALVSYGLDIMPRMALASENKKGQVAGAQIRRDQKSPKEHWAATLTKKYAGKINLVLNKALFLVGL